MAIMGKYCKAYLLKNLRQFNHWTEGGENVKKEKKMVDGKEVEVYRNLIDDDIVYIQENYVVTNGIFKDEDIVFDQVSSEWKDFCTTILNFDPVYETDLVEI